MDENLKDAVQLCRVCRAAIVPGSEFPPITGDDLERIYECAEKHMLEAMVGECILSYNKIELQSEITEKIRRKINASIYRMMVSDTERKALYDFFEEHKIWYLPLKGQILREYYPKPYYRQMGDYDFLYDGSFQKIVEQHLEENGFVHEESSRIDQSFRKSIAHFELHRALSTGTDDYKEMLDYYNGKGTSFLLDDTSENVRYKKRLSAEDFYIYFITHAYKHYSFMSGTGMRYLVDLYVLLNKVSDILDFSYIEQELCKVNAKSFENCSRKLVQKLFGSDEEMEFDREEADSLLRLFNGGVYGDRNNLHRYRVEQLKENGRVTIGKYIRSRLFPPEWQLEQVYPWASKSRLFLLAAYMMRFFHALKSSMRFLKEVREINGIIHEKKCRDG